jgi:hypothetical protein
MISGRNSAVSFKVVVSRALSNNSVKSLAASKSSSVSKSKRSTARAYVVVRGNASSVSGRSAGAKATFARSEQQPSVGLRAVSFGEVLLFEGLLGQRFPQRPLVQSPCPSGSSSRAQV